MMEKIEKGHPLSQSTDFVAENIETLKKLFPTIVKEGKIDIKELQALLGEEVETEEEYYHFTWAGKSMARREANKLSTGTLRPDKESSKNWDTTQNLFIEGDNLEVLKLLHKSYANKVKMIYIDPPYNTGKDFVYKDNYNDNLGNYLQITGQLDEDGKKTRTNSESDGRFHSNWLNMMYPRLKLARNLLKDDGVIFISIDDNEVSNLKKICDEIFGEENFEGQIHWRRRHNQPNDKTKLIGLVAEHIIVYAKSSLKLKAFGVGKLPLTGTFSNPDKDHRGPWASKPWKVGSDQNGSKYVIETPTGIKYDEEWMGERTTYDQLLADNRIIFSDNGNGLPRKKYFKYEREEEGQCATNWWSSENFGHNQEGNSELTDLFNGIKNVFSNPKNTKLLNSIIQLSNVKENEIILDFFAGSGSTAHALFKSVLDDGKTKRFILVQLQEDLDKALLTSDSKSKKNIEAAIGLLDSVHKKHVISEITKERIRRAGDKLKNDQELKLTEAKGKLIGIVAQIEKAGGMFADDPKVTALQEQQQELIDQITEIEHSIVTLDIGFKAFKLDSSNIRTWDGNPDSLDANLFTAASNIKEDRTEEDVLYEILLKYGLDLTMPIQDRVVGGKQVFNIGLGALFICLGDNITTSVAEGIGAWKEELQPATTKVIFKDTGFTDVEKTNSMQILKRFGIEEVNTI